MAHPPVCHVAHCLDRGSGVGQSELRLPRGVLQHDQHGDVHRGQALRKPGWRPDAGRGSRAVHTRLVCGQVQGHGLQEFGLVLRSSGGGDGESQPTAGDENLRLLGSWDELLRWVRRELHLWRGPQQMGLRWIAGDVCSSNGLLQVGGAAGRGDVRHPSRTSALLPLDARSVGGTLLVVGPGVPSAPCADHDLRHGAALRRAPHDLRRGLQGGLRGLRK
mmetsp:Transcript_113253/g.293135  ORF Transcript_113253/g.293135 Transcript_113253/m.293135 type:complete len:219 (+) Transcript_113253:444-1100(+)